MLPQVHYIKGDVPNPDLLQIGEAGHLYIQMHDFQILPCRQN